MCVAAPLAGDIMTGMKKKPKPSGKHSTPRKPVQVPADWLRVIKSLAAKRPAPAVWLIIEWAKREAEAAGMRDLPPVPWAVNGE
jgi:hypothetical protein